MHGDRGVIGNYVDAIYDYASRQNAIGPMYDQMQLVTELLETKELREALLGKGAPFSERKALLKEVVRVASLDPGLGRSLELLQANDRLSQWGNVVRGFEDEDYAKKGIVKVFVESAEALDKEGRRSLEKWGKKHLGERLAFSYEVLPSLCAGVRVTCQDRTYDFSLAHMLKTFQKTVEIT